MTTRVRGTSTLRVTVDGVPAIHRAFRPLLEPEITQIIDAANRTAARSLAKDVKAEARPVSRHMARAVRVKRARTGKPGWVVGSRRKIAFFWHMVINGTRDHGPRKADALVFVPGWNPYLGAVSGEPSPIPSSIGSSPDASVRRPTASSATSSRGPASDAPLT